MQIVIIGNGAVGETLVSMICTEGHNVTVVDENAAEINEVVNKYDVFGVVGNGSSIDIQKEAGVPECDILISVAQSDELNLLCCMIGRRLGAKHAVARVRDPRYMKQVAFMSKQMGIDVVLNPEYEAAREAGRLLRFPAAMKLERLARGQVEVVEVHIGQGHPFAGLALKDFKNKYNTNTLVCTAKRADEAFIPGGDFVICEGDYISITGSRADINELFVKIGLIGKAIKSIILVGGGIISKYLLTGLVGGGYKLKVIEKDIEVCDELAELYPKAEIIHGDAADPDLLEEEGIHKADACVVMTSDDQTNLIISLLAKERGVEKVISKITSATYIKLSENVGIESTITPHELISAKVLRYVRGLANKKEAGSNTQTSQIKMLHRIADNMVEALEFDVAEDFKGVGVSLRELKTKKNLLITAIIRDGNVIYPHGNSTLELSDSVVVMTTQKQLYTLNDILD